MSPIRTRISPDVLQRIERALQSLHYGTVEVTVHHSKVVQIEKREKIRLDLTTGQTEEQDAN